MTIGKGCSRYAPSVIEALTVPPTNINLNSGRKISPCNTKDKACALSVPKLYGFLQVKLYLLFQLGESAVSVFYPFETVMNAR